MKKNLGKIIGLIVLILIIFGGAISRFYTNWLWFGEVGYKQVFWTRILAGAEISIAAGLVFLIIVLLNLLIAKRLIPSSDYVFRENIRVKIGKHIGTGVNLIAIGVSAGFAVLTAIEASSHWMEWLSFKNATLFGISDPIFNKDIAFYIFRLPFIKYIYGLLMFTSIAALIGTTAYHYINRAADLIKGDPKFAPHVKTQLSILLAIPFFLRAWGYKLNTYDLLYSTLGYVYGPGYTDIHARLIAFYILIGISILAGILVLANIFRQGVKLPIAAVVILFGASLLVGALYPAAMQKFYVKPNEQTAEAEYIGHNITSTRAAFSLSDIQEIPFQASDTLTKEDIAKNRPTINSIRLWDYRAILDTYKQLQELWQYYTISEVDVDRYMINGELRQVLLAARELSIDKMPAGTATWQNTHFQYTHGYGAVVSPVNRATPDGLPDFFTKGIPPASNAGIEIAVPQIYFGEHTNHYVIVDTAIAEFDHPAEEKPVYTTYSGSGGIPISNYLKRIAFAWRFGDINMILKSPITKDSRLMFNRNIERRAKSILPFLLYDGDPYLVISEGRLYWMWDAYTYSDRYPYSTPVPVGGNNVNYIRNSVKIVIDAYNGSVDFYIADQNDPMLKTYTRIYPGAFKPISEMPEGLKSHIRYPELMFNIQTQMLLDYHMKDSQVFYTKGDKWEVPKEKVGTTTQETQVIAYYIVMKLPGETNEEFIIMRPFTPADKANIVAWMAVKCDPEDYGRTILYNFPRKTIIYGPAQIESKIDQDQTISPLLSLWSGKGSSVYRGNLLVIPIEQSLIYIKPLYLESDNSKIPQLTRVIVAYKDRIAMENTLDLALAKIFGGETVTQAQPAAVPQAGQSIQDLINKANAQYERAQRSQREGDWATYGAETKALGNTLKELKTQTEK